MAPEHAKADPLSYSEIATYLAEFVTPEKPCRIHYMNLRWLLLIHEYEYCISHMTEHWTGFLKNSKGGSYGFEVFCFGLFFCFFFNKVSITRTTSKAKLKTGKKKKNTKA